MSVSVFDHSFLSGLFGDSDITHCFSASRDVLEMLRFEAALADAQACFGIVPDASAKAIAQVAAVFEPDMDGLKHATARDGVVIPELLRQLRSAVGKDHAPYVHFGVTSQDVIDTSLILRLKQVCALFSEHLALLIEQFDKLDQAFGDFELTGYTRMQAAIPIRVRDRIESWRAPLARHLQQLDELKFPLQFGGAAGTLDKFKEYSGPETDSIRLKRALRARLAASLGLADAPQWQSQRDYIVVFANLLSVMSGSLGKLGQDIVLMAEVGGELVLSGGGASSAMPHKQNPVDAEVLIALARFNAVQVSGMHLSVVHEQERSGAAWTLELMILPQMAATVAAALKLAFKVTGNIKQLGIVTAC